MVAAVVVVTIALDSANSALTTNVNREGDEMIEQLQPIAKREKKSATQQIPQKENI
jgi:hypothetical protein